MPTLREALEAKMAEIETPASEPAALEPEAQVEAAAVPEKPIADGEPSQPRGADGRFIETPKEGKIGEKAGAPKGGKGGAAPAEAKAGGADPAHSPAEDPPPAAAVSTKIKVPQSWKPQTRELAQKLPAEFHSILEDALRRDGEVDKTLNETAEARKFATQIRDSLAPYEPIARSAGFRDAFSWGGNVMQTAAALQGGTQAQRDAILAKLITSYGGTVEGINAHLQGTAPQPEAPRQAQPQVDIQAEVERAIRGQMLAQKAGEFVNSNPEFLRDVWDDMVGILKAAESRGVDVDYKEAYDRAVWANPDTRAILEQRRQADAAKAQAASTQRSIAAASSVRSTPAAGTAPKPQGLRAILEARAAELER